MGDALGRETRGYSGPGTTQGAGTQRRPHSGH
jgi:hypothetical protein